MKPPEEETIATTRRYGGDDYTHRVPAKEHVIDVLRQLKARGDDLNVLTASPHSALDPCLKRLGIYDLFTNVWSCEDFGTTKAAKMYFSLSDPGPNTFAGNPVNPPKFSN